MNAKSSDVNAGRGATLGLQAGGFGSLQRELRLRPRVLTVAG